MSTTDPNENGEDEPFMVTTPGGSLSISNYNQPATLSFVATGNSVTIGGAFGGEAPDGDETGTIQISINQNTGMSAQDKAAMAKAGGQLVEDGLAIDAAGLVVAALPPPADAAAAAYEAVGTGMILLGVHMENVAMDPADPNYTQIAQPQTPPIPLFTTQSGLTSQEVTAFNSLLTNVQQANGLANAIFTSLNRASGAEEAGNGYWRVQQLLAAAKYESQLAPLLQAEPALFANVQAALKAAGVPSVIVTPDDVLNIEEQIADGQGLPTPIAQAASQLGVDSTTLQEMEQVILVQDINATAIAGTGGFVNQVLNDAIQGASLALLGEGTASEAFVTQTYEHIFKTRPDAIVLEFYTELLDQGASQSEVALAIAHSVEIGEPSIELIYNLFEPNVTTSEGGLFFFEFLVLL